MLFGLGISFSGFWVEAIDGVKLHLLDVIQPEQYADMTTVALGNWVYEMMAADLGPDLVSQDTEM